VARIEVVTGDLLDQPDLNVIVNPANTQMTQAGGLARIIVDAAGEDVHRQSLQFKPLATGCAAHTRAGRLPYEAIVHAVGPVWGGGDALEMDLLRLAHLNAIRVACQAVQPARVGFPAVSCGEFGFPVQLAAQIAVRAAADSGEPVELVRFCLLDDNHLQAFQRAARAL